MKIKMKIPYLYLLFAILVCNLASAQNTREYLFIAPGAQSPVGSEAGTTHGYGLGGGVELPLTPYFGVGAEIGGMVPGKGKASNTIGIFSANGYGHLGRDRTFDPFITGGYSLLFNNFTANGANFGVGTNYWFRENVGFLLEGRDHYAKLQGVPTHIWEFRIGLTFR
jgi:hypothetical protein